MDRVERLRVDRPALIDRLADHVKDAPQRLRPHRHLDRSSGVGHLLAAHHAVGAVHGDAAHRALAELLRHLKHQVELADAAGERILDVGQLALELHIDNGAEHLRDAPNIIACHVYVLSIRVTVTALRRRR